jgi:hypothetical protein
MLTLSELFGSTQSVRDKVNPTASFGITRIAPIPIANTLVIGATFNALTDKSKTKYSTVIAFHGLSFVSDRDGKHPLELEIFPGMVKAMQVPSFTQTEVAVACTCKDYYFMWWWWNHEKKSNAGDEFEPYTRKTPNPAEGGRPYVNPLKRAGACKHLLRFARYLSENGWLKA